MQVAARLGELCIARRPLRRSAALSTIVRVELSAKFARQCVHEFAICSCLDRQRGSAVPLYLRERELALLRHEGLHANRVATQRDSDSDDEVPVFDPGGLEATRLLFCCTV